MEKVLIFDTTLRDGEQSPGASMSISQKLQIAKQLARLKVDIIEAGFPASSGAQFEACSLIAKQVKGPVIAGLCRAVKSDIEAVYQALKKAPKKRIHTFIATSDIHMRYKLNKKPSEVLKQAERAINFAAGFTNDIEFSAEDATRSDHSFLAEIVEAAIEAGATTINLPDTVGYTIPEEYFQVIRYVRESVPNISNAVLSVHCHNDLGLGVANSLSALKAGARQIECTVNGIGERAGNASLEEVVMNLKTRKKFFNLTTGINTKQIYKTSRLLSYLTGILIQPNKAIVGKNAFSHEAGIHQHGVLKNKRTYEIMSPKSIGRKESHLVLGRHSGRHGITAILKKMNISYTKNDFEQIFKRFNILADKKKQIYEEDIFALAADILNIKHDGYELNYVSVNSGTGLIPTATVVLKFKNKVLREAACGSGPVDAVYQAIDSITGNKLTLGEYDISAVTGGKDAVGDVKVTLKTKNNIEYVGHGYSLDIIEASAKAYLNAINKKIRKNKKNKRGNYGQNKKKP
ncbi:MAG TPA: 2-isopropylmalate synthase [Spirochaetota bacterium]|nr:2-isopropylmalate synthase [Spirochaetota bacterium]